MFSLLSRVLVVRVWLTGYQRGKSPRDLSTNPPTEMTRDGRPYFLTSVLGSFLTPVFPFFSQPPPLMFNTWAILPGGYLAWLPKLGF